MPVTDAARLVESANGSSGSADARTAQHQRGDDGEPLVARLRTRRATVAVVGCGYVGLPLAMAAAEVGFEVYGIDADATKVAHLRTGHSPIVDVPDDALAATMGTGRLRFTATPDIVAAADVVVIAVPTPLRDGAPDLTALTAATCEVARALRRGTVVVLESTTYPGTTDEIVKSILERASGLRAGRDFSLGYAPERISPGDGRELRDIPRVVGGIDPQSTECVATFYETLVPDVYRARSCREAEMAKLIENTFRQINIALVNELATVAHTLGVDIWDAVAAAATKPYGYIPFWPGPGVGGHCIAVDPSYLSWRVESRLGFGLGFVQQARAINNRMPAYVAGRVQALLNDTARPTRGARIHVVGVGYKPGLSDTRESPAIRVIEHLVGAGAQISYSDPLVPRITVLDTTLHHQDLDTVLDRAPVDVAVLLAADQAVDVEAIARSARCVFDVQGLTRRRRIPGVTLL
jgi:UDP-N-acetyl-D-glucosamine dehydrogenase